MNKAFSRGQTQVLFRHLPGAIFEHDDYGLCRVTSVTQEAVDINKDALFDAMADLLAMWSNGNFVNSFPDPRDAQLQTRYAVGAPKSVQFEPYPATFICRKCSRTARFVDLQRRRATDLGTCRSCGGSLARIRYVQAHNCGRLQELFVPAKCGTCDSAEHVAFLDPGRVKHARWYCAKCKTDLQAMRMSRCNCAYSESIGGGGGFSPEQWLKVVPTGDPSLYITHTAAFVNFPDAASVKLRSAPDSLALVLGRIWGLMDTKVEELLSQRAQASRDAGDSVAAEVVEALRALDPSNPAVKKFDEARTHSNGKETVDRVTHLLAKYGCPMNGAPRRGMIEHVTLMDRTSLTSTDDVSAMLRRRNDVEGAATIEQAAAFARNLMGIKCVRVINDFPLTLAAFGYTRLSRDPARAVLSSFPADDRGRLPVYALSSETEALWFELSPLFVASWVQRNGLLAHAALDTDQEAWAYLYAQVPGIRQSPTEPAYLERNAVAIRTLLHTMSHVFLRRIEWSGFAPSSVGEYLLPGSLSFVLYANRYVETPIGGLTTLFEQRLETWLWDAVQSGCECVYDPICGDDGGSCAGCLHREHNCALFNRELSRATLYGGPLPQASSIGALRLTSGFWDAAITAAPVA
jgi:hypothetical protein